MLLAAEPWPLLARVPVSRPCPTFLLQQLHVGRLPGEPHAPPQRYGPLQTHRHTHRKICQMACNFVLSVRKLNCAKRSMRVRDAGVLELQQVPLWISRC